jgi:predicted dinucleotide-binding enzyme
MNIAIIGTGNVGGALAQGLIKAGRTVLMVQDYRFQKNQLSWQL